ncbi:MAG: hypothetical protein J6A25_02765 [Lachnospiraceae bacterium]|nr:hypothetical protein [Lachnospiraceae bacterium]
MLVKCVVNIGLEDLLELDKVYYANESKIDSRYYLIEDETGCVNAFNRYRFEILDGDDSSV